METNDCLSNSSRNIKNWDKKINTDFHIKNKSIPLHRNLEPIIL